MKIKFSKIAQIQETQLDLKPLTIIIGPNNSNKTYLAYSLYGLLQSLSEERYYDSTFRNVSQNEVYLPITDNFLERLRKRKAHNASSFSKSLVHFFQDSMRTTFAEAKIDFEMPNEEIRALLETGNQYIKTNESNSIKYQNSRIYIKRDPDKAAYYWGADSILGSFLNTRLFGNPFLLPAERNAFMMTYRILVNRRYNLLREGQRSLYSTPRKHLSRQLELLRAEGDIRYPKPIEDFLEFITQIELEEGVSKSKNNSFSLLASLAEKHLMNKNAIHLKSTKFGGKEIKIKVNRNVTIDLYNASSSTKQLSSFVLYLRYRARRGDVLIIDEPEMNLHPESQVKFLEILAMTVNLGIKVLLTTHSPYLLAYINNLLLIDSKKKESLRQALYLQDSNALLEKDMVVAYEMKNGNLVNLNSEQGFITWDSLSNVSVEIQERFFKKYE